MFRQLLKDASVYSLSDFLFRFLNFCTFPLLASIFSLEDFGTITFYLANMALLEVLFSCGMTSAIHRFYHSEKRSEVITTALVTALTIDVCLVCCFLGSSPLLLLVTVAALMQKLFDLCLDVLRMDQLPWTFTRIKGSQRVLSVLFSLTFIFLRGIPGYFEGMLLSLFLTFPFAFYSIRKHITRRFRLTTAWEMLSFGAPVAFAEVGYWTLSSIDRWMLAFEDLGLYGIAFKLTTLMIFCCQAFGLAWNPIAMRSHDRQFYSQSLTRWFFFLVVAAIVLGCLADPLLRLLTPEDFWAASKTVPYLALGFAFYGCSYILLTGITIVKKTYHVTIAMWLAAFLNATLNFLFIPIYGVMGAAITSMCSYLFLSCYYLAVGQRLYPLPIEWDKLALILCLALLSLSLPLAALILALPVGYYLLPTQVEQIA